MSCADRTLDLNALIDGELPGEAEAALLAHIATCPGCAAELAGLLTIRTRLARLAPVEHLPETLARRIEHGMATRPAASRRALMPRFVAGAGALAIAAALAIVLLRPHNEAPTIRAVADASLRQTLPQSAIVLADTRTGGADAWFGRHHLAAPPAPDLAPAGFQFLGCRTDIIAGHRASILVYGHAGRRLTLIAWPADGEPAHKVRTAASAEQNVSYWNNGTLEFWVSGSNPNLVSRFTRDYRAKT